MYLPPHSLPRDNYGTAGTHDLRRIFGTRRVPSVRPATLQERMRHTDVKTAMKYPVTLAADDAAGKLWRQHRREWAIARDRLRMRPLRSPKKRQNPLMSNGLEPALRSAPRRTRTFNPLIKSQMLYH